MTDRLPFVWRDSDRVCDACGSATLAPNAPTAMFAGYAARTRTSAAGQRSSTW